MIRTEAYRTFEANVDELLAMFKLLMPVELQQKVKKVEKSIRRHRKNTPARARVIEKAVSDLSSTVEDYARGRILLLDWTSAVLVTVVLAYMEDGLVFVATKNPDLLKNAHPLDNDRILQAVSIEDLRTELRRQWANKKLLGGPLKWLSLLNEMGAKQYTKDCDFRLQHLWDTRNLIVHGRGIATVPYIESYKKPALKLGDRVHVGPGFKVLKWWMAGIEDFVNSTDQFFTNYGTKTK